MSQTRVACILVTQADRCVGIFTERDVVKLSARQVAIATLTIADLMTRDVVSLSPTEAADLETVLHCFRHYRIRYLPLLDGQGRPLGLITQTSLLRTLDLSERSTDLQQRNRRLETELAIATATIVDLNQQLEQNRRHSRPLHNLFYDLHHTFSNLRHTIEMLEILLHQFPITPHAATIEPYLQVLKDECANGSRLIEHSDNSHQLVSRSD
jgi:predicted transcriptional regulator